MNLNAFGFLGPTIGTLIVFVVSVLTLTLHIGCCLALGSDANRLGSEVRGPWFLTAYQWATAGLLMGVIAVGIYWAIHHSTFSTLHVPLSSEGDKPKGERPKGN